jgi:hypothetical protein
MSTPRFIIEKKVLSKEQALNRRHKHIEELIGEFRWEISRIVEDMNLLISSPLPEFESVYREVFEGDPLYENASIEFSPDHYTGPWRIDTK